jgi:hypothetical protein
MVLLLQAAAVYSQSFQLLRFDEDYATLKYDTSATCYNRLKFIPLTTDKSNYATIGGELRYEYAGTVNEDWRKDGEGRNGTFYQRYVLFADIHAGSHFRFFAQLNSALANGNKNGPRTTDQDQLNIQNLFADIKWRQLLLRLGRQELDYGTGRLISVREGVNVRQYFTGGKIVYQTARLNIDAFVMMADSIRLGVLDNKPAGEINLWGAYAHLNIPRWGHFDGYYLGIMRGNSSFEEGSGREIRHTVAIRHWKAGNGFVYNLEAAYQFGTFGQGPIRAWTLATEIGYHFDQLCFSPTLMLRNDYISGDHYVGDGRLETFNPLYPKGGYFGFNPRIGPANLIDIHPFLTLRFSEKLGIQAEAVFNWRYSKEDGLYRPGGSLDMRGSSSDSRFIGKAWLLSGSYKINRWLEASAGAQVFRVGAFIKDQINRPSDSFFLNTAIVFKF